MVLCVFGKRAERWQALVIIAGVCDLSVIFLGMWLLLCHTTWVRQPVRLHCKDAVFPFRGSSLWKWVTKSSRKSKEAETAMPLPPEHVASSQLIWNSVRYICSSPFIYLYRCVYLFCTLAYNPILHYLFCCPNYSIFGHWWLFQFGSCVPVICSHPFFGFLE